MKIPFDTPGRRWLVTASALALVAIYVALAATRFAASSLGRGEVRSGDFKRLRWAVRLDPGDAEYRNYLGGYYRAFAQDLGDLATAREYYREAAQLNPHSADYWFDLAAVYQLLGDASRQTSAFERAIEADPTKPTVAWEAANLYMVQGANEKALREFRVVLANDASLAPSAIQFCWRIEPDVDALLRDVVPPQNDAYLAFLDLLEKNKPEDGATVTDQTAQTAKVWNALLQTNQPFERRRADEYFRYLILHKDVDQAVRVWQQTADRFGLSRYLPTAGNLIVNGNFGLNVLNTGLDWQYQKQDRVKLELDSKDCPDDRRDFRSACNGRQALTVNFDGPGIRDAGIYQLIAVQPNTTYNFSAYYKTSEQQGAGAPHFTVQDMYTLAIYYESDDLKDAGFWTKAEGEFTTGPDCKLIVLHIRRLPEGHPIRVKLWIGNFRLTRKPA
ncbi:MAG TPA: carbohydrate binding domain-containing protein [Candidatus Sulfotelmatobacter sp.]|jgi:hypothetical protein